MSSEYDST